MQTIGFSGETRFEGAASSIAMGFSGELGGSLEWGSIGQSIVHGAVQVERQVSGSCEWVQGGAIAPWSDGCRESEVSLRVGRPAIRSIGSGMGSMPWKSHSLGDATGARSGTLAKWCCVSPHEGRSGSDKNCGTHLSDNTHLAHSGNSFV